MKEQFKDINLLKAFGILLVVFGHIYAAGGPVLWQNIRSIIYTFHMPIFFIVSGFLYSFSKKNKKEDYPSFLKKELPKFLIPFFAFTLIIIIYKLLVQQFFEGVHLKYPVFLANIGSHFLNPQGAFATFLWFIYALLLIRITYPLIKKIINNDYLLLVIFFLIIIFVKVPNIFCLNLVISYYPYYLMGAILEKVNFRNFLKTKANVFFVFLSLIAFTASFIYLKDYPVIPYVLGLIGTYIFWSLSVFISKFKLILLEHIGKISLEIYLWHTTVVGVVYLALNEIVNFSFWVNTFIIFILSMLILLGLSELINKSAMLMHILYGKPIEKPIPPIK